jgi:hypothetical protein
LKQRQQLGFTGGDRGVGFRRKLCGGTAIAQFFAFYAKLDSASLKHRQELGDGHFSHAASFIVTAQPLYAAALGCDRLAALGRGVDAELSKLGEQKRRKLCDRSVFGRSDKLAHRRLPAVARQPGALWIAGERRQASGDKGSSATML